MNKIISLLFFISILSVPNIVDARIDEFLTTRLKSTSGAGVGSILMDESSILNPAPLAFFNISSVFVQKGKSKISNQNSQSFPENEDICVVVSDSKGSTGGSASYQKHSFFNNKRTRAAVSLAYPVGPKSSMGITYRQTWDELSEDGVNYTKKKYKQFILGVSHAISPSFTFGIVVIDPLRTKTEDTRAIAGAQYLFQNFISVMGDIGADYGSNLSETFLYRAAIQFKLFQDFFLRVGLHEDQNNLEEGNSIGIGWVQPRLVFDLGIQNNTTFSDLKTKEVTNNIKETSFSMSYKF
jgi:hypothetical protein